MPPPTSTMPDEVSERWDRFNRVLRVVVIAAVVGVVVAALFGVAGVTTATEVAGSGNLTVRVGYASSTRPGLATPFSIDIGTEDGRALPSDVTVELPREYLDAFDENGLDPEPTEVSSDGRVERWTFDSAGASLLSVDFDARWQPNVQASRSADVVVVAGGDRVVVAITTRVWP